MPPFRNAKVTTMGAPFSKPTISNYNYNAPTDDGAETSANQVTWAKHKTKLADPIKTLAEAIADATETAFGNVVGGAGVTTASSDYTVLAGDQGKLVKVTASATITTPDATSVGSPFVFAVSNIHTSGITLDGSGSQTIDGVASIVIPSGFGVILYTDGTNWFTTGQNFVTAQPVASTFKNLVITNNAGTPNSKVDISADEIVVATSTGIAYRVSSVSLTIDAGTNGANGLDSGGLANSTMYYEWVIYDPTTGTVAGLLSTSSSSPTLPSGYTAKARVGARPTNGSAQFHRVTQKGKKAQYIVSASVTTALPSIISGANGDAGVPTWVAGSVSSRVPSTAATISIVAVNLSSFGLICAPNNLYGSNSSTTNPPPINIPAASNAAATATFQLESTNIYYACGGSSAGVNCLGWEDNI